jgi:site-specific recombinase XerC
MSAYVDTVARPPRTLTAAEQKRLLKVTGEHASGFRDATLLSVALGAALREHELAGLDVGDVLHEDGRVRRRITLRIFKRSTDDPTPQQVFLPDDAWYKLTKFIAWKHARGESVEPTAPLFISRRGKRIALRTIRHMFRVWQRRAGFDHLFCFHQLRHTSLTNLFERTKDIRCVQRAARHKSLTTTTRYTLPSDEDVLNAMRGQPC